MNVGAVIVAAGRGERLGRGIPKGLVEIDGVPLLMLATRAFQEAGSILNIVLVIPPGFEEIVLELTKFYGFTKVSSVVAGGEERQDSVTLGLAALDSSIDCVLIHDGARPFVTALLIDQVAAALRTHKAAFAALPVADTLHVNKGGIALDGPDRSSLVAAQTPQGFHIPLLKDALKVVSTTGEKHTDEVSLLRKTMHVNAAIIPGDTGNVKITRSQDLEFYHSHLIQIVEQVKGSHE